MDLIQSFLTPLDHFNAIVAAPLMSISDPVGFLTPDKAKYLFCTLLCYPLSVLFRFLPNNVTLKNIYGLVLGLWMGYFVFGQHMIHSIATSFIVFILLKVLPLRIAKGAVLVFGIGYVAASHIYRMSVDYLGWSLDFTGPQMLFTLKFTFYAFDLADMEHTDAEMSGKGWDKALVAHIAQNRLLYVPSTLQYFSYMFWYSTFLAGPTLCPRAHFEFVDMSAFPNRIVPAGSYTRGLSIFTYGLAWASGLVLQGMFVPPSYLYNPQFVTHPIWYKMIYLWISASSQRCTYYFAWLLSEGANIISGMGFNGIDSKTGKPKWDKASNVRPLKLEFSTSIKEVTENWNLGADRWLRYYVYLRLPKPYDAYGLYITYVISAFWHGFYPGYYISFVSAAFVTEFWRGVFKKVRPRTLNEKGEHSWLYAILTRLFNTYSLSYVFVGFLLLSWERIFFLYSALYWHMTIIIPLGIVILTYLVPAPADTKKSPKPKSE